MARMEKVNIMLQHSLAEIINKEVETQESLITISYVECSPDLKNAKIAVSIIPDNRSGSTLEKLRKKTGVIRSILSKKIKLRNIPRLTWTFDPTERNASKLDTIFEQIEKERKDSEK